MKKTNKKKLEEFIRVDHAGERGAIKIYEGQLLALNTIHKDDELKKTIEEMREHEREHCEFFENEIKKRNIKPTKFLPLWDLLGVGLGFGTTLLGKKAAMLCTASVEEVIDKHYKDQIDQLEDVINNSKAFKAGGIYSFSFDALIGYLSNIKIVLFKTNFSWIKYIIFFISAIIPLIITAKIYLKCIFINKY